MKLPVQVEFGVTPSPAIPFAARLTLLFPPEAKVRIKGDPAAAEQLWPTKSAPQAKFPEPGPKPVRSKCNPGVPANVTKLATGRPPVRFKIFPVAPLETFPAAEVMFVPIPVLKQPAVPPNVAGVQMIDVAVTVTPPPLQFAMLTFPIGVALAATVRSKKPVKLRTNDPIARLIFALHISISSARFIFKMELALRHSISVLGTKSTHFLDKMFVLAIFP